MTCKKNDDFYSNSAKKNIHLLFINWIHYEQSDKDIGSRAYQW
jgi:hypothetical protein